MKVWYDKADIDGSNFISEQFLLISFFNETIVKNNKDFVSAESWIKNISHKIEYTDIKNCDIILYPLKFDRGVIKYIKLAEQANKKLVCFYNDDDDRPSCLPSFVDMYRTSLKSSKRKTNEFGLPAWSCDFIDLIDLQIRCKAKAPIVGFCGAVTNTVRHEAIVELNKNQNIIQDFKVRNSFWGGNIHNIDVRMEYVRHMNNIDLVLCCRGAGNFSYRLYECMSLGRIPIIVNTDITLPCEDIIDWKSISVWVNSIEDINEAINKFWSNITDEEYKKAQKNIRNIYETYLSPSGFTNYIDQKYTIK